MKIPIQLNRLITIGKAAAEAAGALGPAIGLKQNTGAAIAADLTRLIRHSEAAAAEGALTHHGNAKAQLVSARAEYQATYAAAKAFCGDCVDWLKCKFGRRWNPKWNAAGFTKGSIAVANTNPLPILVNLGAYLRVEPAHENAELGITAARAEEVLAALERALSSRAQGRTQELSTRQQRDAALDALHERISALQQELSHLLEDDDPRWYQFGLTRPANGHLPAPVAEVKVSLVSPGVALAEWEPAAVAHNYRVQWQADTPDSLPVDAGLATDPLMLLRGLPTEQAIRILITSRNRSGHARPCSAVLFPPSHSVANLCVPTYFLPIRSK